MKRKIIILLSVIVVSILTVFTVFYVKKINFMKKIKNSYNKYVIVNKDSDLYDSNGNPIGYINNDAYFVLDELNVKSDKDVFFKILDSDYYLSYNDVNKTEERSFSNKDYYINLGKKISTGEVTNFYQDNELVFSINNSFTFEVIKSDGTYYYVDFLNQIFQIKIDELVDEVPLEVSSISQFISVLNYNSVSDSCNSKDCVTTENFKSQLNYLKENGYYSIDLEDYTLFVNDFINLKEKAVLITSKQENLNDISSEYGFTVINSSDVTFSDSDTKTLKGNTNYPRYNIIDKTTLDIFKKIMDGEHVVYVEPKVTQVHTLPSMNSNATKIAVLNYHFFFDPTIGETCPDGNCKTVQDFEDELIYLQQNNYKTLTMDEFVKWMYGEIELPARSVLITVDDGAMGTGAHNGNKLIPLLEKYQAHATLFLITGWWSIENYRSPYLDIESHTFDMHEGNICKDQPRGSKLLCSTREQVLEDLNKSVEITGSKNAFCFPMYVYNDTVLSVINEIGFKLAFVGGDVKATRNSNKYKVPRYHIYRSTTLDQFINMIS